MTTASHGSQGQDLRLGVPDARPQSVACEEAGRRKTVGLLALQYGLADRLVFSKIKARMGGKIRFFCLRLCAVEIRRCRSGSMPTGLLVLGRVRAH